MKRVKHAGAVFLGPHTPEAIGDYMAGPNHILPTAGTARFSSPLGVEDFIQSVDKILGTFAFNDKDFDGDPDFG
jgi:histidinol dehydrogenase